MNPYPGLRPFRASEAHLFCGREVADGILDTRVRVSPLTILFARSGVGKSSFLTCRFLPRAAAESRTSYLNEWGGESPASVVDLALRDLVKEDDEHDEKPLLVLDQFEDVFKLESSREQLWECLADWVNVSDPRAHVLISMREEWLGAWGEAADYLPSSFGTTIRLAPLTPNELYRAIARPAVIEGAVSVDEELTNRILADLKKPNAFGLGANYVEPGLLQLVCQRLWKETVDRGQPSMSLRTYEDAGGADQISKDFVWRELRRAGATGAYFSAVDRVLWVGLTRHLSLAQGVKAIVSPASLAQRLRLQELGVAGPAALDWELTRKERSYLEAVPEKRAAPPVALVNWISRVLNIGVAIGFLKRQRGSAVDEQLYELSHDSLSPFLQQFSVEFEHWAKVRWRVRLSAILAFLFLTPLAVLVWIRYGFEKLLYGAVILVFGGLFYAVFLWLCLKVFKFTFEALAFPIMRALTKGDPLSGAKNVKRAKL
jgi:hypothetical protein